MHKGHVWHGMLGTWESKMNSLVLNLEVHLEVLKYAFLGNF